MVAVAVLLAVVNGSTVGARAQPSSQDRVLDLKWRIVDFDGRTIRSDHEATVVALDGDLFFDIDSDRLTDEARNTLTTLLDRITAGQPTGTVTVTGHTDNTGSSSYNLDLSRRRAEAVAAALSAELPVSTDGRGETEPVAANQTDDGRRRNRRVEVRYTPTLRD